MIIVGSGVNDRNGHPLPEDASSMGLGHTCILGSVHSGEDTLRVLLTGIVMNRVVLGCCILAE